MDGGYHDEFARPAAELFAAKPAKPRPARRSVRVDVERPRDAAAERARAFHYRTERTTPLGRLADRLPPALARTLSPGARRLPVVAVRLSSRAGSAVHAAPALTASALYVDHRDLAAIEAGAVVPDLEDLIARLR